jgi:hypothetical protein
MARTANSDDADSRGVARIRGLNHPCADPARHRTAALIPTTSQLLRRMRALARRLLLRARLGQWVLVIHRVRANYHHVTGRAPALLRPRRFTEKMQWRKLFELDPRFAVVSDKLAARDFVAARIGPGRQADLLWVGDDPDAIPFDRLVPPYVLKSTHATGQIIIVRDLAALDEAAARATAHGWLAYCHGTSANEPAYTHLPRRLIVERLLQCPDGTPPLEQKVYVFDGRAVFIRATTPDECGQPRFGDVYARDWTRLPIAWLMPFHPVPPSRPKQLADIISISEHIGAGLSHCRVDIYDCGDTLTVGEVTLYSQSGLVVYSDPAFDIVFGSHWIIRWPMLRALRTVAVRRWEIRPPGT